MERTDIDFKFIHANLQNYKILLWTTRFFDSKSGAVVVVIVL